MARKTSAELIEVLKAHEEALGDGFLGLIEDIADSVVEAPEPDYTGYVKKEEYDALKQRYIDRFTSKDEGGIDPQKAAQAANDLTEPVKQITYADLFTAEE